MLNIVALCLLSLSINADLLIFAMPMRKIFTISAILLAIPNIAMSECRTQSRQEIEAQVNIPKISVQQGALNISNTSDTELIVDVYSITGQLIKRLRVPYGSVVLDVRPGCYIIKCDRWSKKVIVS